MNDRIKRAAALVLAFVMAFTLCACGGGTDNSGSSGQSTSAQTAGTSTGDSAPSGSALTAGNSAAVGTPAPEFVYKPTFTDIKSEENVSSLMPACLMPDGSGFYATGSVVVDTKMPEGYEPQYYGQFDITKPAIFAVDFDGSVKALENYTETELPEAEEGMYDYGAMSYVNGLFVGDDGTLYVLEDSYRNWTDVDNLDYNDEEYYDHYHYTTDSRIRTLDSTGKELSSFVLDYPVNGYMYCSAMDASGNFVYIVSTETGENFIRGITAGGETVYEIPCEDSLSSSFSDSNGNVYISVWGNNGMELRKLDAENKTLGEALPLPQDCYSVITGGGDYPLYYTSGVYFYGFDPASGEEAVKLFNWMDSDVTPDEAYYVLIDADGEIHSVLNYYDSYDLSYDRQLVSLTKTPYDPSMEKKELILATQYLSWELRRTVVDFNRAHDDVRIVIRDYSEYNTEEDYSAGLTKLQTEMMAGNCPDIVDMSGLSLSQLAAKGILEDLYPYMEQDPEIKKENFIPNVIAAAETEGKLMHTLSNFRFSTVVGASSIVGDEPGMTYDELYASLREMPEECTPFDVSVTRDEILSTCLNLDMARFVNWDTGEVDFNNDEFISLLEFAATFPESYDWETYDWQNDNPEARIREGRQMLYATELADFDSLLYIEASYNGTPVTFVGYPTNSGTGNTITVDPGLAMTTSCSDKESAWSFLRGFFTDSYYVNNCYYGFPIGSKLFEKKLNKICTVTYKINNDGEYELDSEGNRIPEEHYYARDDGAYTYYALSQGMADQFMELVSSTTKVTTVDQSIKDIVTKQAAAFFSGQKSAEEVAKLIQSNASIYVNEQR